MGEGYGYSQGDNPCTCRAVDYYGGLDRHLPSALRNLLHQAVDRLPILVLINKLLDPPLVLLGEMLYLNLPRERKVSAVGVGHSALEFRAWVKFQP